LAADFDFETDTDTDKDKDKDTGVAGKLFILVVIERLDPWLDGLSAALKNIIYCSDMKSVLV
jgi:hypothetical protein